MKKGLGNLDKFTFIYVLGADSCTLVQVGENLSQEVERRGSYESQKIF